MTGRPELCHAPRRQAPRIGIVTQEFAGAPEAAGDEALRIAVSAAERAGASVRALALPEIVAEAWRIHPIVQEFEAHQAFAWEYRVNYDAMPPLLRGRLDESRDITPAAYDEARGIASRARGALADIFEDVDVLLTFSAPGAAPKGLASTGDPRFNRLWTLMGVPCVNVPAYVTVAGCRWACKSSHRSAPTQERWRPRGLSRPRWRGARGVSLGAGRAPRITVFIF